MRGGKYDTGTIFSFDPLTSVYEKLKDFDKKEGRPSQGVVWATNGKLYGTTDFGGGNGYGSIFSIDPATSVYTTIYNFDYVTGVAPGGKLFQANDGKLYGMTSQGGSNGSGVIFSFNILTSVYKVVQDFNPGLAGFGTLSQASNGQLYGLAGPSSIFYQTGILFSIDPVTQSVSVLKSLDVNSGYWPLGSLIEGNDGLLYGMTQKGGSSDAGVIFSFDPISLAYTKIHDFDNTNGANPQGALLQASNGKLYGTAFKGGASKNGVIFSLDPASKTYVKLKDFTRTIVEGSNPFGSLVAGTDGKLYGTTLGGGVNGVGIIFSFDPISSTYSPLKDFADASGAFPTGSLVQASDGKLYGVTSKGGSTGSGVIFSFDPLTKTYTVVKDFNDYQNGSSPGGGLIEATNGKLYGVLMPVSQNSDGVIYSFDPQTSTFTKETDFYYSMGAGGVSPIGSLLQANNGKLYGLTVYGGQFDYGVIFSFDPTTRSLTTLHDFDNQSVVSLPVGKFTQGTDGKIYGTTHSGYGIIFSIDPSNPNSGYSILKNFSSANSDFDGASPISIMQASDGKLYGMTSIGGTYGLGTVFSLDPTSITYTKLKDFDSTSGTNPQSSFIEVASCTSLQFYQDADSDGYGNKNVLIQACTQPAGYVTDSTDCDDTKASVHPGAIEICGNGIDDNCNGQIDENCNTTPMISINDISVTEEQGFAKLTVSLSQVTDKPVGILYYTKDGTATGWGRHKDYQTKIGLLVIPAGSLTGSISIKIIKDNIAEPTEYFDVILFRSLNATIADKSGRVTITDDMLITNSKTEFMQEEASSLVNSFQVKVMPNPAGYQFNLTTESNDKAGNIQIKVMNAQGKLIETRSNISPGQTIKLGSNYRPGSYFIQTVQGKQRRTIKVIKLSE